MTKNAYCLAVQEMTKKLVTRVRKDVSPRSVVEFSGIGDIIPVYRPISDGMEFNRTVQRYKTRKEILRLLPRLSGMLSDNE